MQVGRIIGLMVLLVGGNFLASLQQSEPVGLLLTELYYDTPGTDGEREWVEIANVGTAVIDLSDIKIGDEEQAGGREGMVRFPEGAQIEAGGVVVVAQTAVGFRSLFGFNPQYEILDSDANVPNMRRFPLWAGGDVAFANDGDELLLVWKTAVIDAINYGDSNEYFSPSIGSVVTGQSIVRIPANCDTDSAADWQPLTQPTPGVVTLDGECSEPINPATLESLPSIGEIQGASDVSPLINQTVSFRGVVTGTYADRNASGITFYTLFVQDLPGFSDDDPATSDGIAIFLGRERPFTQIGDQVRVTGQVTEFFGYTEIDDDNLQILIEAEGVALPEPVSIVLPVDLDEQEAYLEPLESMLVAVDGEARVVGPTFSSCSFAVVGEGVADDRIFQREAGSRNGQLLPILHTNDVDCTGFPQLKVGDQVAGLVGPLIYHFEQFKLVQQGEEGLEITAVSPQSAQVDFDETALTPSLGQAVSIATFNIENYFDAVDDTGDDAEPKPTLEQIGRRRQKIVFTISQTLNCPTIIGIQEVEHEALLLDLAIEAAAGCGFLYEVIHLESADGRGIDVALLADPNRVIVLDAQLRQTCTRLDTNIVDGGIDCTGGSDPLFSRPPLRVEALVDGQPFTLFVNHFKSKRGGATETAARRLAQAQFLNELVATQLDQVPDARIVVMGDFNDYEQSETLLAMTDNGRFTNGRLTNSLLQIPDEQRYSFIFGGVAQLIDGILLSPALVEAMVEVDILHVNADFPDSFGEDMTANGLPFRSSDHDIPIILLQLDRVADEKDVGVETAVSAQPTPTNLEENIEGGKQPTPVSDRFQSVTDAGTLANWLVAVPALILGIGLIVWQYKKRR